MAKHSTSRQHALVKDMWKAPNCSGSNRSRLRVSLCDPRIPRIIPDQIPDFLVPPGSNQTSFRSGAWTRAEFASSLRHVRRSDVSRSRPRFGRKALSFVLGSSSWRPPTVWPSGRSARKSHASGRRSNAFRDLVFFVFSSRCNHRET